ncbi:STAS domain-containing protein [Actinobacillus suis]|uniref:STAS domain-containing protein n=1 Tax=Actinobacillus suis TaxID=716 RepID=UPI0020B6C49E|nr:STAS domain-containing protein [Actinobacillus suis]UTH26356.1 STAS domain-containing protein [Actinobacillus suis]
MKPQKTLQWGVQQNNESLFVKLSGELTRDTLLPLWKQRASLSPKGNQHIYWDLKDLERVDSAGFTLLAELLNHYQKQTPNWLINSPETVKTLAELFDLSEWLNRFIVCDKSKLCCENA